MSWPVRIILPPESIPNIKWRRWAWGFFFILSIMMLGSWLLRTTKIVVGLPFLEALLPLVIILVGGYLVVLAFRIYYHGVSLSAMDGYMHDAQALQEQWTDWASKPVYILANHFFLPTQIVLPDIMLGKLTDIAKGQALKFDVYDKTYTEEDLFNELLSSVRAKLKQLSSTHTFDVIFTCEENDISFSVFRECWRGIGIDNKILGECYCYKNCHELIYEHVLNSEDNRVIIVVSTRMDSQQLSVVETTEFASILLMAKDSRTSGGVSCGVMLRPMSCGKNIIEDEFIYMQTYQPEIMNAVRVYFSHFEQKDIASVSDVLRKKTSRENGVWEFDVYDLNMVLGQLGGEHYWLVISLLLYFSEEKKEPYFMVHNVGDQAVFNMIKPFDYQRESES
ncbi:hypothetical protein [Citrobacter farmeri]|uniref:hypothetical protein n=1 Tax=Citrobacter farmeri TaxID=67824 RepID=UPI00292FC1E5|nr:hypothetical protein [Citrobacter farmeri]HCC5835714.1 hypothetical protein [Citrobacter farmeri]